MFVTDYAAVQTFCGAIRLRIKIEGIEGRSLRCYCVIFANEVLANMAFNVYRVDCNEEYDQS